MKIFALTPSLARLPSPTLGEGLGVRAYFQGKGSIMEITAAVSRQTGGDFSIEPLTIEAPRQNEVLVRIVATGLCHTDLVARDQLPLPAVFGHEGAGVVEQVGEDVTGVSPGDHVVLSFDFCATCPNCLENAPGYCHNFVAHNLLGMRTSDYSTTLRNNTEVVRGLFFGQSSFATYALAFERNLVKVSRDVPLELLGPLGCGFQTGAGAVMNSLRVKAGASIAIFGAGAVGLSAVMAATIVGCNPIIAVDINDERLELARELGATHTVNPNNKDPQREISTTITKGGVHYALEATAQPQVLRTAVDCLKVRGVCGVIGVPPVGTEFTLDWNNVLLGRTVRGIIEGDSIPSQFIPYLIDLYQQGRFPIDKLVKFYPFEEINQAMADSVAGRTIKPILRM